MSQASASEAAWDSLMEPFVKKVDWMELFVCYSHPNSTGLEAAKKLTESLLETVS